MTGEKNKTNKPKSPILSANNKATKNRAAYNTVNENEDNRCTAQ